MPVRRVLWTCVLVLLVAGTAVGAPTTKKKKKNARPTDVERGKELYVRHCVACHGAEARGDGPMTKSLVADVPNLNNVLTRETLSTYVPSVLKGKNVMPGFELSFDKHDARRVLRTMIKRQEAAAEADKAALEGEPGEPSDKTEEER